MSAAPKSLLCLDYETIEVFPDGTSRGSTEFYRDNFRVDSMAATWIDNGSLASVFIRGEENVRTWLRENAVGRPLLCYNLQFELGVSLCRFPELALDWAIDAQRLVQVFDNGGDKYAFETLILDPELVGEESDGEEEETDEIKAPKKPETKKVPIGGFSLVASLRRIMRLQESHKEAAHAWIRANVPECKKGREGGYLNRLPGDLLREYNIADTENTYRLYQYIIEQFEATRYNWRPDHDLYLRSVREITKAKIRGVPVDRARLRAYNSEVREEIATIAHIFREQFATPIAAVERRRLLEEIRCRKTLRGRKNYLKRVKSDPVKWQEDIAFNVGSNKQLAQLFVDELGIEPKFFTDKGAPSFKSSVLSQWGDGGELLKKRRKRGIVLAQCEALLRLSEHDGKWHIGIKAVGTATSRLAGGN